MLRNLLDSSWTHKWEQRKRSNCRRHCWPLWCPEMRFGKNLDWFGQLLNRKWIESYACSYRGRVLENNKRRPIVKTQGVLRAGCVVAEVGNGKGNGVGQTERVGARIGETNGRRRANKHMITYRVNAGPIRHCNLQQVGALVV